MAILSHVQFDVAPSCEIVFKAYTIYVRTVRPIYKFLFYNLCESLSIEHFMSIPRPLALLYDYRDKVDRHCGVDELSCVQIESEVLHTFERDLECRSSLR